MGWSPRPSFKRVVGKVDKGKLANVGMAILVTGLQGAKAVFDSSPIPGASAVFSLILSCIQEAQKASRNAEILKNTRAHLDSILKILEPLDLVPESAQDPDVSRALNEAALNLILDLSTQAEVVREKTTHSIRPSWMTRSSDEDALQDFVKAAEDALTRFQLAQGNRVERYLETIKLQSVTIREGVEVIKEQTWEIKRDGMAAEQQRQVILQSTQAMHCRTEVIADTTAATKMLTMAEASAGQERDWDRIIENIKRAPLANYNAERPGTITGCSEETRVEILEEISGWIDDPDAHQVYWLKERAGFGKTSIAVSVAEQAARQGQLAASFFFSHQVPDLNNAALFFPTVAFQLAHFDQRRYRQFFADAVKHFPDAETAKLVLQAEELFLKPLQRAEPTSRPLVIVVDALDECKREHAQELASVLTKAAQALSLPIRLFITSRPEHHLIGAFKAVGISSRPIVDRSKDDVETYLRKELAEIPQKLDLDGLSRDWISERDIVALVKRARGLFVYASTAIRFIGDPIALNPKKHLQILLRDDEAQSAIYRPYEALDRLYTRVLDVATGGRPQLVEEVRVVLGGRIALEESLSLTLLAPVLGLEVDDIRRTLVKLQSVVADPEWDGGHITFHHASFKEFLLDRSRSGPVYFIDLPTHHHHIALQCMKNIRQSRVRQPIEWKIASDDFVVVQPPFDAPSSADEYPIRYVFCHISKASKDIALKEAFDKFFAQSSLWWYEYQRPGSFPPNELIDTYNWRINEGSISSGIIVLVAFTSLLKVGGLASGAYYTISSLARKELRRYYRLAKQYPEGQTNTDQRVVSLHQNVRQCIDHTVGQDLSVASTWVGEPASVAFAEELQGILDEFMVSMGNHEEVEDNRRRTKKIQEFLDKMLEVERAVYFGEELPQPIPDPNGTRMSEEEARRQLGTSTITAKDLWGISQGLQ